MSAQQGICGRLYFDSIDVLINSVIVDPVKPHSLCTKDMSGQLAQTYFQVSGGFCIIYFVNACIYN